MALHLPPAVSIDRFVGGFKSISDYTDLADTETNDAENTIYGPNGDIDQRLGSLRLLNSRLTTTNATAGRPITGHYWFDKLGVTATSTFHVVGAGDSLFSYTSSTASRISTGLTDSSAVFWNFIQISDPRSPADDILLAANGVDAIQVWNGSGTATKLNLFTSATQVPICKYLLNHKERVYAANIVDSTDVDSPVKIMRTGFGTDAAPDPHRFTEFFYAGGSSRSGDIRGIRVLNDQIIIYCRAAVWKFNPSSGDTNDLTQMQARIGLFAPFSLVDAGNFHIFLSEAGVWAFDGNTFIHLSEKIDDDLLRDANLDLLQYAKASYNKDKNQYILYYADGSSTQNNRALIYDMRPSMKIWQPPVTGRRVSFISTYDDVDGIERNIIGDYSGYLYEDGVGLNDGQTTGYNGVPTAAAGSTLTDAAANFLTTGDGLSGLLCKVIDGPGVDQERLILTNTSSVLTLDSPWGVVPTTASTYSVAAIDAYWRSKDYDFGNHDLVKIFRHVRLRMRELGSSNLVFYYIVGFKELAAATFKNVAQRIAGFTWDVSRWGKDRWDGVGNINKKVSLRNTSSQSLQGTHLALRFANRRANESMSISGFDIEFKAVGKR